MISHRIGWWENLQESPIFDGKNHGFRLRFSLKRIQWFHIRNHRRIGFRQQKNRSRYLQAGEIKKRCEAVGELSWNIPWPVARWLRYLGCGTHLLWLKIFHFFFQSQNLKWKVVVSIHAMWISQVKVILFFYETKHGFSTFMWIFLLVTHIFPNERLGICSWTWKAKNSKQPSPALESCAETFHCNALHCFLCARVQYPQVSFS